MLKLLTTKKFEKDLEKIIRSGKDADKLKSVVLRLLEPEQLEAKYRNHKLRGEYQDRWECHIEPDWLLIYKKTSEEIVLERTGSHSELFR
jgi:mRNA interferase YafQ